MKCPNASLKARKFRGESRNPIARMRQYGIRGCRITALSRMPLFLRLSRQRLQFS